MNARLEPSTLAACRETIAHHSKSFSLASRLLPGPVRDRAVVVYTWCRRADDAVDRSAPQDQAVALLRLRNELTRVYQPGEPPDDPVLVAFGQVARARRIPVEYPEGLLRGMEMDVRGRRYDTLSDLIAYCFCVAGTVGLMMSHAMGLRSENALANATHLGIAMQLTNICRDVIEDWQVGRLYLPRALLADCGAPELDIHLGQPFPEGARRPVSRAIAALLAEADRYYRSGDRGMGALTARCALGVRAARLVYAAIGDRLRAMGCDPMAGRAVVPLSRKLALIAAAAGATALEGGGRLLARRPAGIPTRLVRFPQDVLPVR